jgi:hypothetical protein
MDERNSHNQNDANLCLHVRTISKLFSRPKHLLSLEVGGAESNL